MDPELDLAGRRIVVGVCGGIAAYKAVGLASALHQVLTEPVPISRARQPGDAATAPEDGPQGPDSNAR